MDLEYSFPPNVTRLYFGLLNMSNRLGWKNPFGATNQQLAALVQCDIKTLIKCRNLLVNSGLITVSRGWKNKPTLIELNEFVWNYSSEYSTQSSTQSSSESSNHHKTKTKTKIYREQLEEVFNLYPRRIGKIEGLKQIKQAIKDHGLEFIIEKTKAYAKAREDKPMEYTPHPATWFFQERFNEDPATWAVAGSESGSSSHPWGYMKQLELVEAEIKRIKERHAYPEPGGGYSWKGVSQRHKDTHKKLIARRNELKPKAMGL